LVPKKRSQKPEDQCDPGGGEGGTRGGKEAGTSGWRTSVRGGPAWGLKRGYGKTTSKRGKMCLVKTAKDGSVLGRETILVGPALR